MRKTNKIFLILIITFLLINIFSQVFATINPNQYKPSDITEADTKLAFDKVGIILGAVRNISVVVSVIVLMVIGLRYMFGSVEEKADYKKTMMPYIIGCVLAVSGTTIVTFIYNSMH